MLRFDIFKITILPYHLFDKQSKNLEILQLNIYYISIIFNSLTYNMPANKSALLRYHIIDSCLTNNQRKFPRMEYIVEKIEEQLQTSLSNSMFTKDIDSMRRIYSAPIQYDRVQKGYHYTEPDFSISKFPLTHEEIEALDFSTALFQQLKHTKIFYHFETAINKVIEGYRISKIIGKSETQLLQVEEPVKAEDSKWLEPILKAIINRTCLTITYHGFGKPEKQHIISPYLLKEYRNRWYTIGYSAKAKNILVLALDRITSTEINKENFITDKDFTPESFFKYSFGITQINDGKAELVELLFTAQQAPYIISQPLHHSQQILCNNDKGLHIQLLVYLTPELLMAILSYGAEVKVLAPQTLIELISLRIKQMNNLY